MPGDDLRPKKMTEGKTENPAIEVLRERLRKQVQRKSETEDEQGSKASAKENIEDKMLAEVRRLRKCEERLKSLLATLLVPHNSPVLPEDLVDQAKAISKNCGYTLHKDSHSCEDHSIVYGSDTVLNFVRCEVCGHKWEQYSE